MSELARNRRNGLTVADTGDIDLSVENGTITDSNGKSVTIGTSYNEIERSFGKEDAAVTHVKGDTPTGDLRVAESGNIVVDGYGSVSLVGSRNEVSFVENANGFQTRLFTDSSGNIRITESTTGSDTQNLSVDVDDRFTEQTFIEYPNEPFDSYNDIIYTAVLVGDSSLTVDERKDSGRSYMSGYTEEIWWTQSAWENGDEPDESNTVTNNETCSGRGYYFTSGSDATFTPPDGAVDHQDVVIRLSPIDLDGDGTAAFIEGDAVDAGDVKMDGSRGSVRSEISYDYEKIYNEIVSLQ